MEQQMRTHLSQQQQQNHPNNHLGSHRPPSGPNQGKQRTISGSSNPGGGGGGANNYNSQGQMQQQQQQQGSFFPVGPQQNGGYGGGYGGGQYQGPTPAAMPINALQSGMPMSGMMTAGGQFVYLPQYTQQPFGVAIQQSRLPPPQQVVPGMGGYGTSPNQGYFQQQPQQQFQPQQQQAPYPQSANGVPPRHFNNTRVEQLPHQGPSMPNPNSVVQQPAGPPTGPPFQPHYRQPGLAVSYDQALHQQQQTSIAAPIVKRERKVLVFTDPNTNQAVLLPHSAKLDEPKSSALSDSSQPSFVASENETHSATHAPQTEIARKDSVTDEDTAKQVRDEFQRKIQESISKKNPESKEGSASPGRTSPKPIVITPDTSQENIFEDVKVPSDAHTGDVNTTDAISEPLRKLSENHNVEKAPAQASAAPTPVLVQEMIIETRVFTPPPSVTSLVTVLAEAEAVPFKVETQSSISSTPRRVDSQERLSSAASPQLEAEEDGGRNGDVKTPAEENHDMNGEDSVTSRLVYTRNVLMELDKKSKNSPVPDWIQKGVSIIKDAPAPQNRQNDNQYRGDPRNDPRNNQGRRDQYGPPGNQKYQDQPQQKVLRLTQDDFVPPPTNPNAWKAAVGKKVLDPELADTTEAVLLNVRGLLNKLTPNNYKKLSAQMLAIPFTKSSDKLTGTVDLIFEKALDELNYAGLYAQLCRSLIQEEATDAEGKPIKVRTILLQRAQRYFEKTDQETREAAEDNPDVSPELANEKREKAKRRYLGNIRFISELYKCEMLTEKVILSCFQRLLPKQADFSDADEEKLECLCKLLMTCGQTIKADQSANAVAVFYKQLQRMIDVRATSSRIRFLMQDAIDLKNNNYVPRKNVAPSDVKPKTIDEIHAEKRQEEMAIKTEVANLPPLPRGQQMPMRGGIGGGGGLNMGRGGAHLQQQGGMTKTRSVPSAMSNMNAVQSGRGGRPGMEGSSDVRNAGGALKKPANKFLSTLAQGNQGSQSTQQMPLGPQSNWSKGSNMGSLRPNSGPGVRIENKSASSSRDSSLSRHERSNQPRGSLTNTPSMRDEAPLVESFPKSTPSETPVATPRDTPTTRSPVPEEITEDMLDAIVCHMISTATKSEDTEFLEAISDSAKQLGRMTGPQRVHVIIAIFNKYCEAKTDERRKIVALFTGVARERRLPVEDLSEGLGQFVGFTDDLVVDVPNLYGFLVELVGPLIVENLLALEVFEHVLSQTSPQHAEKYLNAFRIWLSKLLEDVPAQLRQELTNKWPNIFATDQGSSL